MKKFIEYLKIKLNKLNNLKKIKSSEPLLALQYNTIGGNQIYFNKYLKYKSKYLVKKYGQINILNEIKNENINYYTKYMKYKIKYNNLNY